MLVRLGWGPFSYSRIEIRCIALLVISPKKFTPAQRNYSVIEQELLAIILALQHFEIYVPAYGPKITILSDHSHLQFLDRFKFKNVRLTRWSLLLQEYNLEIKHVKGVDNVIADCLSRAPT